MVVPYMETRLMEFPGQNLQSQLIATTEKFSAEC